VHLFLIENYILEIQLDLVSLTHPTYGEVIANVAILDDTVFAYSTAVVFSNDSSSDYCVVLFVNNMASVTAISRFINRYAHPIATSFKRMRFFAC